MIFFQISSIWVLLLVPFCSATKLCEVCQDLFHEFVSGYIKTVKSNFGGGNTDWEEKSLGKWRTSEARMLEILEHVCPKSSRHQNECYAFREKHEDTIENWWFNLYKEKLRVKDLYNYLCVEKTRLCCPDKHFGPNCESCHFISQLGHVCNGHGTCDGNGTRVGSGNCSCLSGYTGENCDKCELDYFPINSSDGLTFSCESCHRSCSGGCHGPASNECIKCASGWIMNDSNICTDVDECSEDEKCNSSTEFCKNTEGSYSCEICDSSCDGCTGDGSTNCIECQKGYQLQGDDCQDINECSADSNLCRDEGQKCTNTPGSYSCDCDSNYDLINDKCVKKSKLHVSGSKSKYVNKQHNDAFRNNINQRTRSKVSKSPKKIWTKRFEREFFKFALTLLVLGIVVCLFKGNVPIVILAVSASAYYIYSKCLAMDKIFKSA